MNLHTKFSKQKELPVLSFVILESKANLHFYCRHKNCTLYFLFFPGCLKMNNNKIVGVLYLIIMKTSIFSFLKFGDLKFTYFLSSLINSENDYFIV